MNALLVNPWITDFAAYDFWIRPLGLLWVGAFLEKRGHTVGLIDCLDRFQEGRGYEVTGASGPFGTGKFPREIIDTPACLRHVPRHFNRYGIPVGLFRTLVTERPAPDIVLVTSMMTYWYHGVFEAIALIREILPGVPVLLGGVYASLCTEHARSKSGADDVVTSPSPSVIVRAVEETAGIAETGGDLPGDGFPDWPEPAWRLYRSLPTAAAMTSRGCPMRCTVCASHRLFDGFERRDPLSEARSIAGLASRGVRDCAFSDDALLLDAERYAAPLFGELARLGAPVRLHSPNGLHVRAITPDIARLMKRAGMATVRLSLETASERRAGDFSGKVSREDFRRAVKALSDAGFTAREIGAYVLAGLPGQTVDEVRDTVGFVHGCGVPVKPALFSPVPGTVEFERAVGAGMVGRDGDPALQNNTLRAVDWFDGGEMGYRRFRREVTLGNERVLRG